MAMDIPQGFRFAGVSCAIKTKPNTKDVTLIVTDRDATAAAVYTQNQVVAAPVVLSRGRTPSASIRAVVVNSGNANACTGVQGDRDAVTMTEWVARHVESDSPVNDKQVLVMSTGVIGRFLPMDKIERGIHAAAKQLRPGEEAFLDAADGIMTTDAFRKVESRSWVHDGKTYRLAGMAKGAGMIGPKMATMLACVLTDVALESDQAQRLLRQAVDKSFNCISVEGHTSTNDTLLLLASGAVDAKPLTGEAESKFREELHSLCINLAKQIPDDGEGATHLIEIRIEGAPDDAAAHRIASTVAASNLVKAAITGGDPNWGRIVSATGYSGVPIEISKLKLVLNGHLLFDAGEPKPFEAKTVSQAIKQQRNTLIELTVGYGSGTCRYWTSDLTVDYVKFNSEYTT